jgi:8-oxo-dGTP diphosphatase
MSRSKSARGAAAAEQFTEYPIRVSAAIFNNIGSLLVVRHSVGTREFWTFPGGTPKSDESLQEAVIREVREETGYSIDYVGLLAVGELHANLADPGRIEIVFNATVRDKHEAPQLSDRHLNAHWRTAIEIKDAFVPIAFYWAAIDGRGLRYLGDITENLKGVIR